MQRKHYTEEEKNAVISQYALQAILSSIMKSDFMKG